MVVVKRVLTPLPLRSELLHFSDELDAGPSSFYADNAKRDAREFRRGTVPLQARDFDNHGHDNDNLSHRHRLASAIKSAARSGFHRGSIPEELLLRSSATKSTGSGRGNGSSSKERTGRIASARNANHQKPLRIPPVHVLSILEPLLEAIDVEFSDALDIGDFSADFQVERMDSVERATIEKASERHKARLKVFTHPLRHVVLYAYTPMLLGSQRRDLPIVVVSCVEELYRTGIFEENLFRTLPNRSRLYELITLFDSSTRPPNIAFSRHRNPPTTDQGFGSYVSMHTERTPDICALLATFISSLPEPVVPPHVSTAIWEWCNVISEDSTLSTSRGNILRSTSSWSASQAYTSPGEVARIHIARLLLLLLPSANLSLLAYLLSFFSQASLVPEQNGATVENLGKLFGYKLFGGDFTNSSEISIIGNGGGGEKGKRKRRGSVFEPSGRRRPGEIMMCWFLRRWQAIFDGLFEMIAGHMRGMNEELDEKHNDRNAHVPRVPPKELSSKKKVRMTDDPSKSPGSHATPFESASSIQGSTATSSNPPRPKAIQKQHRDLAWSEALGDSDQPHVFRRDSPYPLAEIAMAKVEDSRRRTMERVTHKDGADDGEDLCDVSVSVGERHVKAQESEEEEEEDNFVILSKQIDDDKARNMIDDSLQQLSGPATRAPPGGQCKKASPMRLTFSSVYGSDDDEDMFLHSQSQEPISISHMPPTAPLRTSPKHPSTTKATPTANTASHAGTGTTKVDEQSDLRIRALEQAFVQNQAMLQSVATELAVLRMGTGGSLEGGAGSSGQIGKPGPPTSQN